MLAGILLPRQGTVRLEGLDPKADRKHYQRRLGFLSAGDRGLHARMRVEQHLDYWARLAYVPRSERPERVAAALEAFGLEPVVGQRVDRCSQGWRQRIRLAMAFLHDPDVILLDEPRNSLDDDGYAVLDAQVRGATARGGAVLWCSPRGEDRVITADQTFTLENGRLERTS
jgi:ABC-2 type transport system ATP-binding protein